MQITVSEWKIINLLWQKPMTIMQLTKALYDETKWTKYTVITLLKRMLEKNTVYFVQDGRTKCFYPNVKREDAEIEESEDLLNKVFDGKLSLMVSALASRNKISDQEIDALCKMLNLERTGK